VKRAMVTGSAGFVGRHIVDRLVADGFDVSLCDLGYPWPNSIDCRTVFAEDTTRYDLVVHCAAVVGGRAKIDGEPLAIADNLSIDAAAMQWALRTRPHHFIYFSSSAAYPVYLQNAKPKSGGEAYLNPRKLVESDIDHKLPELADQTYGLCKLVGERLAAIVNAEGVPVHVFRPFSGYGADQSADEYPFPSFIDRAVRKERPFTIWGTGDAVRDWVHVDDIVNAVMCAVNGDILGPVNLCTGIPTTFNDLARTVCGAAGYTPLYDRKLGAPTGVAYRVGDPTLLNTFYTPQITLQEGIERALFTNTVAA
jgi:nucleoside-diphosphate-sugar epimerase